MLRAPLARPRWDVLAVCHVVNELARPGGASRRGGRRSWTTCSSARSRCGRLPPAAFRSVALVLALLHDTSVLNPVMTAAELAKVLAPLPLRAALPAAGAAGFRLALSSARCCRVRCSGAVQGRKNTNKPRFFLVWPITKHFNFLLNIKNISQFLALLLIL